MRLSVKPPRLAMLLAAAAATLGVSAGSPMAARGQFDHYGHVRIACLDATVLRDRDRVVHDHWRR
jgi:hypothetical protein